jgi:hypothetical protein
MVVEEMEKLQEVVVQPHLLQHLARQTPVEEEER